jgi:hypothetical protein
VEEEKKIKKKETEGYEDETIQWARTSPSVPNKIQAQPTVVKMWFKIGNF